MEVRDLTDDDRGWAEGLVSRLNASSRVVSRGVLHDTRGLPGLIAERDGIRVGLLHYHVVAGQFEVVVLVADPPRQGAGRSLLGAAERVARSRGCERCWLVTTNDNRAGLSFYRAIGWRQVAVHRGAVREARRLKPEIPEFAANGTPIEDEIEFELLLRGGWTAPEDRR
jgi:GNAT superfamily N-acetyltransferase